MLQKENTLFVIAAFSVLCCVFASIAFTMIPENVQEPSRSTLENRLYQTLPNEGRKALLLSGELQLQVEQFLADRVPVRDEVILLNASIQRTCIKASNLLFEYPAFHTFFGSNRVAIPALKAVYRQPANHEYYNDSFFELVKQFCNGIIEGSESIHWYYYLPDSTEISEANPAHALVANHVSYSEARQRIAEVLPGHCYFLEVNYIDSVEYSEKLFHTDHHFQIDDALDFYHSVCQATNKQPYSFDEPFVAYEGPFIGSSVRARLDTEYSDSIKDLYYDMTGITAIYNGKAIQLGDVDKLYSKSEFQQKNRFENVYVTWFHNDASIMEYYNPKLPESVDSLLLISDSYDSSSDRFFSANYSHVYEIDSRHIEGGVTAIRSFIDQHPDIEDVVIVISLDVYYQMQRADVV